MNVLLDTHALLWALYFPDNLGEQAKAIISDPSNDVVVSTASLWEIEIKHAKKPDLMPYSAKEILAGCERAGYSIMSVKPEHILLLASFMDQGIHNDPFDHLLLSTARCEGLMLLTHDELMERYQGVAALRC